MTARTTRYLIVNADDFGYSPGVNRGIVAAYERGIVTSASLMVRWPAAEEATQYARANPDLSVGLHLDLCEWIYRDSTWSPLYQVVPLDDRASVEREIARQLARFQDLVGRAPTHLDSHQHVHRDEPVRTAALQAADELGIPLRSLSATVSYSGEFYGQLGDGTPYPAGITVAHLVDIFDLLPPGVTELGCHPGYIDGLNSVYRAERELELRVLCDPVIRAALQERHIELQAFVAQKNRSKIITEGRKS